jgi:hypothetical protein
VVEEDGRTTTEDEPMTKFVRYLWFALATLAAIILFGAVPVYYNHFVQSIHSDPYGLEQFSVPFQLLLGLGDLASSFMSFALAILLFWRKSNDRMALFISFFCLITAGTGFHLLDYSLTAYFGAPSTYELWPTLLTPLWILLFCIFPDGRFVPRWTLWLFLVSIITSFSIFAITDWRSVSLGVLTPFYFVATYVQVYRYRRVSNYSERQQTKWWLYGLFVSILLFLIALLIYKKPGPPLLGVTPLFLTIAILRYRLFDIDIIIRRTLVYGVVTVVLALSFNVTEIIVQQLVSGMTGQFSQVAIIVSTLAVAALFNPLRHRVQDAIDHRFYRRKYDAQQVLARFAQTVRDEVELEKLTGELLNVVNETMQPTSVSLWLKKK